jgi:uncharacterized protein YxjI
MISMQTQGYATQPPPVQGQLSALLMQQQYMIRRKVLKLFGGAFHVYDPAGQVIMYSKMKAFKLKEDIRLYTDESMSQELMVIQARSIIDFGASYDVTDSTTGQRVGTLRRKGLKSTFFKDEWLVLDAHEQEVAVVAEESAWKGLLRRYVEIMSLVLPQRYIVTAGGRPVAIFKQNFNPFVYKLNVDLRADPQQLIDRRLALASGILMAAVEGKQG